LGATGTWHVGTSRWAAAAAASASNVTMMLAAMFFTGVAATPAALVCPLDLPSPTPQCACVSVRVCLAPHTGLQTMVVSQSRGRVLLGAAAATALLVAVVLLGWGRDRIRVHHYRVRCHPTGPSSEGALACVWAAETQWRREGELLACIDLPSSFRPELAVVRALVVGATWTQAAPVVHLPGSSTVCVAAVAEDHRENAWVTPTPTAAGAVGTDEDGPTHAVFVFEYTNATAALLDPEPEVARRAPLHVKTPIAYVGTILQTPLAPTDAERAAARAVVRGLGTGAADVDCRTFVQAEADRPAGNCSALYGQELATCRGPLSSDPTSALAMLARPVDEWRLRRLTWYRTAAPSAVLLLPLCADGLPLTVSLACCPRLAPAVREHRSETSAVSDVGAPWGGHRVVLVGDSMLRKLAAVWTASLTAHEETIPCACGTRSLPQPLPSGVAHIPLQGLSDTLDGALRALRFASASAEPGDVLVVGAGLWDAAYGSLAVYSSKVRDLLLAAAGSRFGRVVWVTTTAIHPGRRRVSEHHMNAVLTWHNYFTTVRVDAVNVLALRQLRRLERLGRIAHGRIEVVDTMPLTRAAPWMTVPGDMVHYCSPLLVELQYLLLQQLALGAPGQDARRTLDSAA
jgi:hypothetical protein